MYPETIAPDNPDLAAGTRPSLGSPAGLKPTRFGSCACWRAAPAAFAKALLCLVLVLSFAASGTARDRLRLAAQKTGTLAWELSVIREHGLDEKAGIGLEVSEIATPEAAKIALLGGAVDMILSDWLWVARERALSTKLVFWPYSTALGAVMVPPSSPLRELADLQGRTLAVAGGPIDKSWLLLQALARRSHLDLAQQASIVYGAPALIYEKAAAGEADASLNYWNFCAALEAQGFKRLIGIDEVERRLGAKGPVAMVGYAFSEEFAKAHPEVLRRFFDVTRQAQEILATSDEEWQKIAQRLRIASGAELTGLRSSYLAGIPRRALEEEIEDARTLYRILAESGGQDLVGNAKEFDEGTFYQGLELAPAKR